MPGKRWATKSVPRIGLEYERLGRRFEPFMGAVGVADYEDAHKLAVGMTHQCKRLETAVLAAIAEVEAKGGEDGQSSGE